MRRILMMALVGLVVSGPAWGYDAKGSATSVGSITCGEYLDAYSRSKLTGAGTVTGLYPMHRAIGWISGFLTAINMTTKNGRKHVLGSMTNNDARRWVASWCRDNISKDLAAAVVALMNSQTRPSRN
jgi:hypothetical protein